MLLSSSSPNRYCSHWKHSGLACIRSTSLFGNLISSSLLITPFMLVKGISEVRTLLNQSPCTEKVLRKSPVKLAKELLSLWKNLKQKHFPETFLSPPFAESPSHLFLERCTSLGVIHSTTDRSFQLLYSLSSPSILSVIPILKLNQMCVYVKQPMLYAACAFCMTFSVKCNMSGLSYVILSTCSSLG